MALSFSKMFKPKTTTVPSDLLDKIEYTEGTKFAENKTNKIYIDIEELGGFPYLKTVIIGDIQENIKRTGCTITFVFKDEEITLTSDNTTVESNQIKKTGIFYTPIDFELDESEAKKIRTKKVIEVKYTFKKNSYCFKTV